MTRSIWKGPFSELLHKKNCNLPQKVWSRRSTILPKNIDTNLFIHNGKGFVSIKISEEMVGHKFGEVCYNSKKTNS